MFTFIARYTADEHSYCIMKSFLSFNQRQDQGLSLIETVIGAALFAFISMMLATTYQRVFVVARAAQERVDAIALANAQFEIVRNLSYANVGTVGGIPNGVLPQVRTLMSGGKTFVATTTVRNIDLPFDGTAGGVPDDLSPADNKLVEMEVTCTSCKNFRPLIFTTSVGPRDLENVSTNGSLFVRVLDASGAPVPGATVKVVNNSFVPAISIIDVTNASGMLQIIDAPPDVKSYEITVSKSGYSSEQTYGPPVINPVKPHATVIAQTVTQLTFAIDRIATLNISSVSPSCVPITNAQFELTGSKQVSSPPGKPKHDKFFSTDASGLNVLNDIEWDSYVLTATSAAYEMAGVTPLFPFAVVAGSVQDIQLVMVPKDTPSVVVTVIDSGTGLPITGATVTIDDGVHPAMVETTGRGYIRQTDWSGGGAQEADVDQTQYWAHDGNVDPLTTPGEVRLKDILGSYPLNGYLESSTFDTGAPANFFQFTFQPTVQPTDPIVGDSKAEFQIATGNATSSWTYLGPDGTPDTFYTSTTTDIAAANDGKRYLRYKMFLGTASTTLTPSISDIQFTFTSSCVPPGQVIFHGLANGVAALSVAALGYTADSSTVVVDSATPWQEVVVTLSP
ncbi:MAG: hypothetical protein A2845_00445 [Candidatus Lloydbacteria bacterium RIFCSPHIGHO2_01_FULL_49_22]|uniref:Carboxypeptidase regulatory-like domain-containing protein n=1 Tax=Candidatus Lloydbacteria bacterium RIFCSPHIGHO2_01_FULL_49_22 TaxID=1798658 RepID=A0A1G2D045_9BACT|nr:MAG: hypothetical protein A2845_00445 [Candidatus Lloydbacteria bacterium RIFCSPHIGHO2_01_FULL_49_22]OGZ09332.1 MAG: hypothetical protein A3C14_05350 [Candidatus Lloydbacteria bacterium RIFCSPHIGHO2_02_FULL_50_18]